MAVVVFRELMVHYHPHIPWDEVTKIAIFCATFLHYSNVELFVLISAYGPK